MTYPYTIGDFRVHLIASLKLEAALPRVRESLLRKGMAVNPSTVRRMLGIIASMTNQERQNPLLALEPSRCRRICRGAHVTPEEVPQLVRAFRSAESLMESMADMTPRQRMEFIRQRYA